MPRLKTLSELPATPITILQPDGASVPIPLKEVTTAKKKLGVWTCPVGDFGVHIKKAGKTGEAWVKNILASRCPPRNVWLGLWHQLYRKMAHGSVALSHPPSLVQGSTGSQRQPQYYQGVKDATTALPRTRTA